MRKLVCLGLLLVLFVDLNAQERITKGQVLDEYSKEGVDSALVEVYDTNIFVYTLKSGEFNIMLPKRRRHLYVSKEGYEDRKIILGPGFQHKVTKIYLQSQKGIEKASRDRQEADSLFLSHKNVLSLSLIELLSVAIALRYERFISFRHSAGIHVSFYVYGFKPSMGSEFDIHVTYHGIKPVPFYRFYPLRKKTDGVFIEAKIPFGYFSFSELQYRYSTSSNRKLSISHSFWTWGLGVSLGVSRKMPRTSHGVINLSIGYQYFPIVEPTEYQYEEVGEGTILTYTTETDWWYMPGPGSYFELKFTIGGVF